MTISSAWPILIVAAVLRAQDAGPVSYNSEPDKVRQRADSLFASGKYTEALPLYTALEKRDPNTPLLAERRAAGLIAKSATLGKTSQQLALQHQAYFELLRARGLGDNSPYVTSMLAKLNLLFNDTEGAPSSSAPAASKGSSAELLTNGQVALAHGDYSVALRNFTAALRADPDSYEAALQAGECESRLHHMDNAGAWFRKAIDMNPNREVAYLAWGNILLEDKKPLPARDRFLDAIVAWPYSKESWDGLRRWTEISKSRLSSPRLERPASVDDVDPKSIAENGTGRSAWLQYIIGRVAYKNSLFRAKFPNETQYRHTLLEETSCLQRAAEAVKTLNVPSGKLDPNLATLMDLYTHRMLEPWVLLHGADNGIVKDYPAFRDSHRDLLRAYILQYDIHAIP